MQARRLGYPSLAFAAAAALTGCGSQTVPSPIQSPAVAARVTGQVYGGQQPVIGATVTVWATGADGYGTSSTPLASVTTDANGAFSFPAGAYTCPYANQPVYLTASGGNAGAGANSAIMLAAGLGSCSAARSAIVNLNEVTTVATAFALGQFFTPTLGGPPSSDFFAGHATGAGVFHAGLVLANTATIPLLVDLPSGTAHATLTGAGGAVTTIDAAKIYSMANTLAACVNSVSASGTACSTLFSLTTPPGGATAPSDTLQAAVQMALFPYQNVTALYNLASPQPPFTGLPQPPNDWTVGVSYTTPTLGLGISATFAGLPTSSNIDIDATGRVWFPSNKPGASGLAYFDPATGAFSGPFAGASLTAPQYLSIDQGGTVWATDQASGNLAGVSSTNPGGTPLTVSIPGAYGGPVTTDFDNTLFFTAEAPAQASQLFSLDPGRSTTTAVTTFTQHPTGLIAEDTYAPYRNLLAATMAPSSACAQESLGQFTYGSTAWSPGEIMVQTTASPCVTGGIALDLYETDSLSTSPSANQLCSAFDMICFTPVVPLSAPQGIATDGANSRWIANSGNGSISTLFGLDTDNPDSGYDYLPSSPVAYLHDASHGGTMSTPFGIAIDRSGNVWVSNAGCVTAAAAPCATTSFTLSELVGAAAPAITPLSLQEGTASEGTEPQGKRRPSHTRTRPQHR